MKNNWIGKVLGEEAAPRQLSTPSPSILQRVLGEEEEEPKAEPKPEPTAEAPEAPAAEAAPEVDVDTAAEPGMGDRVSDPVQALASLWSSGGKMDVAVKLLTEPVRYTDFIGLVQAIGPESALELGQILDELVEGENETPPPADSILNRVDGFKKHRSAEEEEHRDFRERHAEGDPTAIAQGEQ